MGDNFDQILHLLQAKISMIWVNSPEETRVVEIVKNVCYSMIEQNQKVQLKMWSITQGVVNIPITEMDPMTTDETLKNPIAFMQAIKDSTLRTPKDTITIWIARDFGKCLGNRFPDTYRAIRDLKEYSSINDAYNPIIVININEPIPLELKPIFYVVDFDYLKKEEIADLMNAYLQHWEQEKETALIIDTEEMLCIAELLKELRFQEICNIIKLSLEYEQTLSREFVLREKIKLIKKTEILDYVIPNITMDDIGGNENFKEWVQYIKASLSEDAKAFGCAAAKGYLALGIPGCAKSKLAEALAHYFNIPLVRFNISKILCRFVGESEKNIENALRLVRSSAPCIFLIDEVEKLLGATNSNSTDGGTTARVISSILQFLQEDTGVITVMTSNDVSQLPPELTRPGRLDKIWFFNLPDEEERKQIFRIHLDKTHKPYDVNIINEMAQCTNQYTGAEIELIVKESIWRAFKRYQLDHIDKILLDDLLKAKESIIPISESYKEKIAGLEYWSRTRAQPASKRKNTVSSSNRSAIKHLIDKI